MTKAQIHEKLSVGMLMPNNEANRELSGDEAVEYQNLMEKILKAFRADDERENGKTAAR